MHFEFSATNNEAEYEALIAGLRIAARMGVRNLEANVDSRLVANHVLGEYVAKEDNMIQYLDKTKSLIQGFDRFTIRQVPRGDNKKADALSKIASTSFAHLSKQGTLPHEQKDARRIRCTAQRFELRNGVLYRRSFLQPWLRYVGPIQEDTGKLGPKWEGPYEVTEALGKGAYKMRDMDGRELPRTWNIYNLKKCYL
ncbi:reverse transcriptase domain-containing protein [Tanacetum coccineum]